MVAPWKIEEVKRLRELIRQYSTVGLVDIKGIPATQMHEIRAKLRGKILIRVARKRLIERALKAEGLENLCKEMPEMPALVFSNLDPFEVFKLLEENKAPAPARPGQVAEKDIVIPAGPTDLTPGPVMSKFSRLKIPIKVEKGKITIVKDTVVVKAGEVVTPEVAELLNTLGIKPFEIGLSLRAATDKKLVYSRDVLEISMKDFSPDIKEAFEKAFFLSIGLGIPTPENILFLIRKAFTDALALAVDREIPEGPAVELLIKRAYAVASRLSEIMGGEK